MRDNCDKSLQLVPIIITPATHSLKPINISSALCTVLFTAVAILNHGISFFSYCREEKLNYGKGLQLFVYFLQQNCKSLGDFPFLLLFPAFIKLRIASDWFTNTTKRFLRLYIFQFYKKCACNYRVSD